MLWLTDLIFKYVKYNGIPIKVLYEHKHGEEVLFDFANVEEAKNSHHLGGYLVYAISVEDNTLMLYVD